MKLLLVENHQVFAETVKTAFLANHDVVVAPSLVLARERLAHGAFDAILVDYDLDDGKGTQLVREVRAGGFTGRIVAISSHDRGNGLLREPGADVTCSKMKFAEILSVLAQ